MKNLKKASQFVLGVVIRTALLAAGITLMYIGCMKAFSFGMAIFSETGVETGSGRDVVITVPVGATTKEVAGMLKEEGIIEDTNVFMIQSLLYEGKFLSGTYTLNTSMSPEEIVSILSKTQPDESETT